MSSHEHRAYTGVLWPPGMSAIPWAHGKPDLANGATEPWVGQLMAALLVARGGRDVLELGVQKGYTSVWLIDALQRMGGGTFRGYDAEAKYLERAKAHAALVPADAVTVTLELGRSPDCLHDLPPDSLDFVFVDDDHDRAHVAAEVAALQPLMRPGGMICGHDVFGRYGLGDIFRAAGGHCLNTVPRVDSWGLGIWQRPA